MKELSTEEKAKAYDELFAKAKQIYNKENDVLIMHTIEDLFPELVESEDERIKKEIIAIISNYVDNSNTFKLKMLDWLEKQGEQKLPIEKLPSEMKTIGESLGFTTQKECDEYNKMVSDLIISDDNFNDSGVKKVQAKSLWHEYYHPIDKDRLFLLISKDKRASIMSWDGESLKSVTFGGGGGIILEGDKFAYIDELQEIQKIVWGEEDDDDAWMNDIISKVENNLKLNKAEIDWLKSLRLQNHWKPSDEQTKALHDLNLTGNISYAGQGQVLIGLYNDLKKLTE